MLRSLLGILALGQAAALVVSEPCCSSHAHIAADFGPDVLQHPIHDAALSVPYPEDACSELDADSAARAAGAVALVARGTCNFTEKAERLQAAGARGLVVYDNVFEAGRGVIMSGAAPEVRIPSVFVAAEVGLELLDAVHAAQALGRAPRVALNATLHVDASAPALGVVELLAVGCLVVVWGTAAATLPLMCLARFQRGARTRATRKLPTRRFEAPCGCAEVDADSGLVRHVEGCRDAEGCEMCSICLEEFRPADALTVLPCDHHYHGECVRPWLAERSGLCPLCKRDAFADSATGRDWIGPLERRLRLLAPIPFYALLILAGLQGVVGW